MSSPLLAFANIAAMTASSSLSYPPFPPSAGAGSQSSASSSSASSSPSASPSLSSAVSTMVATDNRPMKKRPMKKRWVPAAAIDAARDSDCLYNNQGYNHPIIRSQSLPGSSSNNSDSNNKRSGKRAKTSRSEPSRKRSDSSPTKFETKSSQPSFPVVMMAILSASQNKDFITFLSDKQSFIIVHPEALAKNVLPMHFEGNVPSFDQFLNLLGIWGFENISDSQYPRVVVFRHPDFREGDWEACLDMKLPSEKAFNVNVKSEASSPQHSPDIPQRAAHRRPSPRRHTVKVEAVVVPEERIPSSTQARPVTPPEVRSSSPPSDNNGMFQCQVAASQWMKQSVALEQMIMATAETRNRLSGFKALKNGIIESPPSFEDITKNVNHPEMQNTSYRSRQGQGRHTKSNMRYSNLDAKVSTMISRSQGRVSSGLTDAQVQMVTQDVVSAAVAALQRNEQSQNQQQQQQQYVSPAVSPSSSASRLDAMTEVFLERSNARRLQSRPAGIFGASPALVAQFSEVVDSGPRAYLGQHCQL